MNAEMDDADGVARRVFAGLVPRSDVEPDPTPSAAARIGRGVLTTVPILLVGSMAAMTLNLTGPIEAASAKSPKPKGAAAEARATTPKASTVSVPTSITAPPTYSVGAGDTVSDIASRFGLSTASVLALNGLSWSSLIFPGQQLKLVNGDVPAAADAPAAPSPSGRYTIVAGDTISAIANRFGVSTLSVLAANGLGWGSIIYPGQRVNIPGLIGPGTPSADGDPAAVAPTPAGPAPVDPAPVAAAPEAAAPVVAPAAEVTPAPAPASAPAPAPVVTGTTYTIQDGDTLSGIAARFGIGTPALLTANGLDLSSVIFSGHTLTIPGIASASYGGSVRVLGDDARANARVIIQVGRNLGVPDYGIVIALATAMQESGMRNLSWGDLDSVGLFQQRPSAGWGSVDQLTDPSYAAQLFYGGPSNPNAGRTRGLLDIGNWQSLSVAQAAQSVQISAYPDAYAKWEKSARDWLAELG